MNFTQLNVDPKLIESLNHHGLIKPTEIQRLAIPFLLEQNQDFIGKAQTGTGKTLAFTIPLLQKIDAHSPNVQALILTPTRELAFQVYEEISKLVSYKEAKCAVFFGGTPYDKQIREIKKERPQIIIGTPGRVIDLINKGILKTQNVQYFVLDEADEMLNRGFFEDIQIILPLLRPEKHIWMFSATLPKPIKDLIAKEFHSPEIIEVKKENLSNENIEQCYFLVKKKYFTEALKRILDSTPDLYAIIFCRTKAETRELSERLLLSGHKLETLHGDIDQTQRDIAMAKFKSKKVNLLICTDVAARGIDVNNLTHVINYGIPQDIESYVHRIGRTGRAGAKGTAITFLEAKSFSWVKRVEKTLKTNMTQRSLPSAESLKTFLVQNELQTLERIILALKSKEESEFKVDSTFEIFSKSLKGLTKEEILKAFFTWRFNKKLKSYQDLANIEDSLHSSSKRTFTQRREQRPPSQSRRPQRKGFRKRY